MSVPSHSNDFSQAVSHIPSMKRRILIVLAPLTVVLFLSIVLASSLGPASVSFDKTAAVLLKKIGIHLNMEVTQRELLVVDQVRLPRVLVAALVGAALATSGTIMQGLFRNPLAEPGIVGVSAGAAAGAVVSIAMGWSVLHRWMIPASAFVGAISSIAIIFSVWSAGRQRSVSTLLLVGIGINSLLGAFINALMTLSKNEQELRGIVFWLQGGLDARTWEHVSLIATPIIIAILVAAFYARDLNMMLLGEEQAQSSGVNVRRTRGRLLLLASLMTAVGVAVTGIIGFVGLVVPHILRMISGPDHRLLLPASALGGGLFLVLVDALSRIAFQPHNLQVGVVTALVGAPLFLFLALRGSKAGIV